MVRLIAMNSFASKERHRFGKGISAKEEILAKYDAIDKANASSINEVDSRMKALRMEPPTFGVLLEMELLRLRCIDREQLAIEVEVLRGRWKRLGGRVLEGRDVERLDRPQLLAEATVLTGEYFHQHEAKEQFARAKRAMVLWMFLALLVLIAVGLLFWHVKENIIGVELFFGALGGFVSTFTRVYQFPPADDPVLSAKLLRSDWASLVARPVLGALFAIVVHLLFVSQLLAGGVFPVLHVNAMTGQAPQNFADFFLGRIQGGEPDPSAGFAKLLVWCFVAGFAERFVPDVLDRLSKEHAKAAGKNGIEA